jgi:hypothetical protein
VGPPIQREVTYALTRNPTVELHGATDVAGSEIPVAEGDLQLESRPRIYLRPRAWRVFVWSVALLMVGCVVIAS